ncbi:TlpA family protein disulfide reductase [Flexithrix dorotheae]|uniref:TlpA family protein disulfide reductase n=1 Tax=Flexithrix dorotheae TaxID=70993 RepID=UPI00037A6E07|nr:TlpA disulfide reductase family protein [Flexithrix dorotheae]
MNIQRLFFILSITFLLACNKENKLPGEIIKPENNQITLIFKSAPARWKINLKAGGYTPAQCELKYIDDRFIPHQFYPNPDVEFDTLIVPTKRKLVEFRHSYKGWDELSYIFYKGDTVLINYQDKTPFATIKNRVTKPHNVNLDLIKKETIHPNDYSSLNKAFNPIYSIESYKNFKKESQKIISLALEKYPVELKKEKDLLDSLLQNELISEEVYSFFITKTNYQKKILELKSIVGEYSNKPLFINLVPKDFEIGMDYKEEFGWIERKNILDSQNDSLLYFGFYQDIADWFYFQYLGRKVGRVKSTSYFNGKPSGGSNLPNYLSLYDSVDRSNLLSTRTANVLRVRAMQDIIENNSIEETVEAFAKFEKDVKDTALVNYVVKKYGLSLDSLGNDFDLRLVSTDYEYIKLDELLEKHKGKVVYIDFWSSGCVPCIKEFKFSKKLEDQYGEKDVVQIYISLEPYRDRWLKACKRFDIRKESYFIENKYSSKQFEDMNIKYVPHYIIYDKNGQLVNKSAPRPSEKKLISMLDKYLSNY